MTDTLKDIIAQPSTFEWALIQMKAGKMVRRPIFPEWFSIVLRPWGDLFVFKHTLECGNEVLLDSSFLNADQMTAADWEIAE